ncbi:RHS repeat domain-containing protein [Anaerocaecibacter muris]|uniref:RHS repeat domain-containing protein n=1 Tax=Anaerocaecibacter muris TaxID=2941513 RepID=UPI003F693385
MESLGVEAIISLVLAGLSLIVTFIGHYFYVRGKLHKAAAGAITNAEQDDKTGAEKLELAVDQVYGLVPASLKVFIHRSSVRKIVQAAFDKIEDYAKKQVEKKSKKKEEDGNSADANDESESAPQSEGVLPQSDEFSDSGGEHEKQDEENNEQSNSETDWQTLDDMISLNADVRSEIATTLDDTAPDEQSDNQVKQSRACSINNNSIQEKIIMENNNINNVIDNANINAINDEPVTCYEDIGAGTEYSKQFTNPKTGLHTAVLFSSPIDNNDGISTAADGDDFIDALNDEGEEVYENRRNKFLIRLAKSTAQNKLVELIQDDYKIAMSPVAAVTSKLNRFVGTIRRDIQAIRNLRRDPKAAKSKITELIHGAVKFALKDREPSDVRFANIINNCDLEYLVENNRLKENIIVNAKSEAYEYLFNLNLGKLEARMSGKQIELYDAATNEVKFLIPAPYMYDMANEQSDAVEYMLEGSAGNYTLRVIADEAWINSDARQFPVVIDPQIMGNTTSFITMQCQSNNSGYKSPASDTVALGYVKYTNLEWSLKTILNASSIRSILHSSSKITHAVLELTKTSNNQPHTEGFIVRIEGRVLDKFQYNGYNNRIEIDITDVMQAIVNGSGNINLIIERASKADKSADDFLVIATEKIANSEYRPRIFVDFVSARMDTDEMAYETVTGGAQGSGYVNLATQKLKWIQPDINVNYKGLPLSISHIYDDYICNRDNDSAELASDNWSKTSSFACGKGWKLNLHQHFLSNGRNGLMGSTGYLYIDGKGNHHEFVEKYYYKDPTHGYPRYISYTQCAEESDGSLTYSIGGKKYDVYHEISNEFGMTLESYRTLLDLAIQGKKVKSKLNYIIRENGKRERVYGNDAYTDSYGSNKKSNVYTVIEYADGTTITVGDKIDVQEIEKYLANQQSYKEAINNLEFQVAYLEQYYKSIENDNNVSQFVKTKTLNDLEQARIQKRKYESELQSIEKGLNKHISQKKREPIDFVMNKEESQILGFDYDGRLVLVGGENGRAVYIIYDDNDRISYVADKDGNALVTLKYNDSGLLKSVVDIEGCNVKYFYKNGRLDKITTNKEEDIHFKYNLMGELESITHLTDTVHIDHDCGKVIGIRKGSTACKFNKDGVQPYEEITVLSKEIYGGVLTSTVTDRSTDVVYTYVFDILGRPLNIYKKDGDKIKAVSMDYYAHKQSFSGNCDFNKISNILNNGDFASSNGWTISGDVSFTTDSFFTSSKVVELQNNATIKQNINISLGQIKSGQMYLFSAWAKATSWYIINNRRHTAYGDDIFRYYESDAADSYKQNRTFGLIARVYKGADCTTYKASFDNYNLDWQLCMLPIYIDDAKAITNIEVELSYQNNQKSALFTDCALFECRDFIAKTFDADNLLSSKRTQDGLIEYVYDNKRLDKATFINSSGKKLTAHYKYDGVGRPRFISDFDGNCQEFFYDEQGNTTRVEEYNIEDTSSKYVTEYEYDENGNVLRESDPRGDMFGERLASEYVYRRGVNTETISASKSVTAIGYNRLTEVGVAVTCDSFGDGNTNNLKYTQGYLTTVSHNGFDIDYEYDGEGRLLTTDIAGVTVKSNTYNDLISIGGDNNVIEAIYLNDATPSIEIQTSRDRQGKVKSVVDILTNLKLLEYTYENDKVIQMNDGISNLTYNYTYTDGNLTKTAYAIHGTNVEYRVAYDEKDSATSSSIVIGNGLPRTCTNTYEDEIIGTRHILKSQTLPNGVTLKPELDALGRLSGIEHVSGINTLLNENRYYVKRGDRTCNLISSERYGINGELTEQTKYIYDKAGNVSEVYENGRLYARYFYDGLSRLIREDNIAFNTTTIFTYDVGGNITAKNEYAFTLGDIKDKTPISIKAYSYVAKGWRDQMTVYDGERCVYDKLGRPTTYRNNTLEWDKYGPLTGFENIASYRYNAQGIRIAKTVNGKTTKFFLDGTKIVRSVIDNEEDIWYNYGVNGIQGITVNNVEYMFRKNIMGDVTHIYKLNNGKLSLAAKYVYDAWGKCAVENVSNETIGDINPIRYRGYYYDKETALYYLNARYYDPEVGRFISADSTQYLEPNTINGLNLYAYCGNNPVMFIDPHGTSWKSFWKGVGDFFCNAGKFIAGMVIAAVSAVAAVVSLPFTSLLPGGGFVTQFLFSLSMYGGFMAASTWDDTVNADMEAIGWNPFNSNENAVLNSSKVSFYKGAPVFRTDFSRSGTFMGIFLRRNVSDVDEVRHEWGHIIQQGLTGAAKFGLTFAITSSAELSNKYYYDRPWEITADILGGVQGRTHSSKNVRKGWGYLAASVVCFPLSYLFLIGEY